MRFLKKLTGVTVKSADHEAIVYPCFTELRLDAQAQDSRYKASIVPLPQLTPRALVNSLTKDRRDALLDAVENTRGDAHLHLEGLLLLIEMEYGLEVRVGSWSQIAQRFNSERWGVKEAWWETDEGTKLVQDAEAVSRVFLRRIVLESLEKEVQLRKQKKREEPRDVAELKEAEAALKAVKYHYQTALTPFIRGLAVETMRARNYGADDSSVSES